MDEFEAYGDPQGPDAMQIKVLRAILESRTFKPSDNFDDIERALVLGRDVLGGGLVSAETVLECEIRTRRCFFVRHGAAGAVEGFIGLLFLNEAGYQALMYGAFTPAHPNPLHLALPVEQAMAIYVWCLAGNTDEAKRALVRGVIEARRKAFPDIALFARPVSREGRMMTAALDAPGAQEAWLGWVPSNASKTRRRGKRITASKVKSDGWDESSGLQASC